MSSLQVPLKHLDAEIPGGHSVIFGALGMLFHDSCLSDGSTGNFYYHGLMTVVSGMLRISRHFLGAGTRKTHGNSKFPGLAPRKSESRAESFHPSH